MSVRKVGDKWQARVDMGTNHNGKRMQPSKTFSTKREAEAWDKMMEAQKGSYSDFTVAEFWDGYYVPFQADRVRELTLERYKSNFDTLVRPTLGFMKLVDVKPLHIQNAINKCNTYGAKKNLFTTMRQLLRKARAWNMVATVATDGCELPPHRRDPIVVADGARLEEYLQAVQEHAPHILAGVCCSMLGMRRSEVCGLEWSDFTFGDQVTVHIQRSLTYANGKPSINPPKTEHSERTLVVPDWIVAYLRPCRGLGPVVTIHPDAFSRAWLRAIEAAGLPRVTLKNLRHSVGTALIDSGASLTDTQNWLGHDLPTTTAKFYVQKTDASIERASEILGGLVHNFAQECTKKTLKQG